MEDQVRTGVPPLLCSLHGYSAVHHIVFLSVILIYMQSKILCDFIGKVPWCNASRLNLQTRSYLSDLLTSVLFSVSPRISHSVNTCNLNTTKHET